MAFALAAQPHGDADGSSATGPVGGGRFWTRAFLAALVWAMLTFAAGGLANVRLATPGRVANNLVETARDACVTHPQTVYVTIPVLGSRWLCNGNGPPTLVGEISRSFVGASYSASNINVSDDLTYIELVKLRLSSPAAGGRPALKLAVEGAKLRGVWPLARPTRLGDLGRAAFVSVTAVLLGLVAAALSLVVHRDCRRRWLGVVEGLLIAASAWMTLFSLDSAEFRGPLRYSAVPLAGCAMALLLGIIARSAVVTKLKTKDLRKPTEVKSPS
ncbi:MAG: hypothetical protein QM784_20070 [Polyangiaceae bacterium]